MVGSEATSHDRSAKFTLKNTTEPIDPDVWDLLRSWARWCITEIGPDIVRAKEARDAMRAGLRTRAEPGDRTRFAIDGRLQGRPWTDAIDYYEVDQLVQHLATACAIVVAAMTGMRSMELRSLTRGCCRRIDRGPGRPPGYEVSDRAFKRADSEGNAVLRGQLREHSWWGVPPLPEAIAMAERLHDDDILFPASIFRGKLDRPVSSRSLNRCVQEFIAWSNATARQMGLSGAVIDEDPAGPITTRRFRRTIARAIQRRPESLYRRPESLYRQPESPYHRPESLPK